MPRTTYLTLDAKGRATLPDEVRETLGIGPGDFVRLEPTDHGTYELVPAELVPRTDLWHLHPEFRARMERAEAEVTSGKVVPLGTATETQTVLDRWKQPAAKTKRPRRKT